MRLMSMAAADPERKLHQLVSLPESGRPMWRRMPFEPNYVGRPSARAGATQIANRQGRLNSST